MLEREIAEMLQQELRALGSHPLLRSPDSSSSTIIRQSEGQGHKPEDGVDAVVDERTMHLLTREMERMVIEGRLENEPRLNREGVDDGFVDTRKKALDRFRVREQERQRRLQEEGFHGSRRGSSSRLDERDGRGGNRDGGREGSGTNHALPSPVSPVRSLAALQEDAALVPKLDLNPSADSKDEGRTAVNDSGGVEGGSGLGSRAWSPLNGVADGGGSALGLGYVRARSKSC